MGGECEGCEEGEKSGWDVHFGGVSENEGVEIALSRQRRLSLDLELSKLKRHVSVIATICSGVLSDLFNSARVLFRILA